MKDRTIISAADAPSAVGPYSQAVKCGGFLFCSGQIPINPATGELVDGGVAAQTERCLENLDRVVKAAGASLSDVVKTTVFMVDLAGFGEMNAVYSRFFSANPPARSTIQVSALPKGASVEVEAIVALP